MTTESPLDPSQVVLTDPQLLIDRLIAEKLLTEGSLASVLGKDFENPTLPVIERAIIRHNVLTPQRLRALKQAVYGLPVYNPSQHRATHAVTLDNGAVLEMSRDVAGQLGVLLIDADYPVFAAVENYYVTADKTLYGWLSDGNPQGFEFMLITNLDFLDALKDAYEDVPVITLPEPGSVHSVLAQAITEGASDIHLSVGQPPTFRVDGSLRKNNCQPISDEWMRQAVITIGDEDYYLKAVNEFQVDFAYPFGEVRFRVSVGKDRNGINIVARRLPATVPHMNDLGLPPVIREFVNLERGLVLITGPTGSGKSTTLASLLGEICRYHPRHIITLEEPIEYVLPSDGKATVNQREVGHSVKSFEQGLRQALRQDPDVILVGELRDTETIRTALLAAETGHLVFATTHTTSAEQSLGRLMAGYSPEEQEAVRQQIAGSLRGIVGQKLIPKASGKGRVACFEILINSDDVANNLRKNNMAVIRQILETSSKQGMQTMDQGLANLTRQGVITEDAALFNCRDRDRFYSALHGSALKR